MKYGKPIHGGQKIQDVQSKELKNELRKIQAKLNGRVTANHRKITQQYYHWRSLYRMFLDPHISTNIMAMLMPIMMQMLRDYTFMEEKHWFVLFFLYNTPYAHHREIRKAWQLRKKLEKAPNDMTQLLYNKGLIDRKTSLEFFGKQYFYIISLKGKALIEATCNKSLSREVLKYINHKHDHLKGQKDITKRAERLKKWDWYDVPSAAQFEILPFNSKPRAAHKQTDAYKKWEADLRAAGKWYERKRPPSTDQPG